MPPTNESRPEQELDDFIRAYEAEIADETIDLAKFLPPIDHPLYGLVLRELVRIDLERRWSRGRPRPLQEYQSSFPELSSDRESLNAITFEEYRLRRQAGEEATPSEYEQRFGVDVTGWPGESGPGPVADPAAASAPRESQRGPDPRPASVPLAAAAAAYLKWLRGEDGSGNGAGEPSREEFRGGTVHADVFSELHRSDPVVTESLARAVTALPQVGHEFLGFPLLAELGSGAFGRVYISRQGELADRLVVLKIVPHLFGESRTLARLQHAHIVPVYSVHQSDAFQAVCMPFLGTTTLADILKELRTLSSVPTAGRYLIDRVEARSRSRQHLATSASAGHEDSSVESTGSFAPLAGLTYVEAILWLAVRLADALAHAHSRGIVHRDLKPANILLTDDGRPMLLDFNLSEDDKLHRSASAARVGGTLPYMAPEQLAAFQNGESHGDERSDLYSLGIIIYEMLTGRNSAERRSETAENLLQGVSEDRNRPPPLRRWNASVTPAVESIVHHCLEPEPSRRYQTARELAEDLRRQLEHRDLKYATDRSRFERAWKWTYRHPRLSSAAGVGVVAATFFTAIVGEYFPHASNLARFEAKQKAEQIRLKALSARRALHDDLNSVEFLLGSSVAGAEREQRTEGLERAWRAIDRHGVMETPDWRHGPLITALETAQQREEVLDDMGELLMLVARAVARPADIGLAQCLNDLAADCYPRDNVPWAWRQQRAQLLKIAGQTEEAQRFAELAGQTAPESPRDRFLHLLVQGGPQRHVSENLSLLRDACRSRKDNFGVWLILGNCYAETGAHSDAVDCYEMAAKLRPESHWPVLCRGLFYLELSDYQKARTAFSEVIRLKPAAHETYYDRALASYHLEDYSGSHDDLTYLLNSPEPALRAYFLRARVRAKQGDREGATQDRERGLRGEPRDERDWTARGLERQAGDPHGALADYQAALEIAPRYRAALQGKAAVLSKDLGRIDDAIATLDTLLGIYPNDVPARAGRGVLHARLGHLEAAHSDAREAIGRDESPFNTYQVAGIYALTSRQNPDDRQEALRLLASALRRGFGKDLLDRDHDLDAIRADPEFHRLIDTTGAHRSGTGPGERKS